MREVGLVIAEALGNIYDDSVITLDCKFEPSISYLRRLYGFNLTPDGLFRAVTETVMSRYVGLIELSGDPGSILDIVFDTTETHSESAVLACVNRSQFDESQMEALRLVSVQLGAELIV